MATLNRTDLLDLVASGGVTAAVTGTDAGLGPDQIQPSSIDLRLAAEAFHMPGSVLPRPGEAVRDVIKQWSLQPIDLSQPSLLARGQVYLVRLQESLRLPAGMAAYANSKSSTGRIDLATRVVCDGNQRYDRIPAGYEGDIWLELIPRSFDVVVAAGVRLTQMICFVDRTIIDHTDLVSMHDAAPMVFNPDGSPCDQSCLFDGRVLLGADLDRNDVGFVAIRAPSPVNLTSGQSHDWRQYFAPLPRNNDGYLFLERDRFYILVTRERLVVPAEYACEMVPYDPAAGEFRAHYAGFFDPGWGVGVDGRRAVLEVRPHEDDLILRHGQPICAMAYERLTGPCDELYGQRGNNYADQDGPRLSKFFADAQ
jgi:dCTP deaminase